MNVRRYNIFCADQQDKIEQKYHISLHSLFWNEIILKVKILSLKWSDKNFIFEYSFIDCFNEYIYFDT